MHALASGAKHLLLSTFLGYSRISSAEPRGQCSHDKSDMKLSLEKSAASVALPQQQQLDVSHATSTPTLTTLATGSSGAKPSESPYIHDQHERRSNSHASPHISGHVPLFTYPLLVAAVR